jgi:undecaprenyl-diphosphatase
VHRIWIDGPTDADRYFRRAAERDELRTAARLLSPLFPLGLPGAYIVGAYAIARWLRRREVHGGAAIVNAAWNGWFAHRGAKLVFRRERPHQNGRRRTDSFPSGHTTGATALALTTAYVLHRHGLISKPQAIALGVGAPVVMGSYRVIADDHWATDVLAGWLLGSGVASAT